ncbi:hypothetical protein NDU88_003438 [Pleurodeles waltl]|uniref:Uncharacterized protein n=1 Tax=Pleurodeles waltl TaxID=8319 RepID=A0AAV7T4T3_PLEWA|nr:hypothetical protein NDU88_003438 [Pleurodeles waltl]
MAASIKGMRTCLVTANEHTAAYQGTHSPLCGFHSCLKDIAAAMREMLQQLPSQTGRSIMEYKLDSIQREVASLRADTAVCHRDVAANLKNQKFLLAAVMPYAISEMAATGNWDSTS